MIYSWQTAIGLTILCVAGYILPLMGVDSIYFRPRTLDILLIPSLLAFVVLMPVFWWSGKGGSRVGRYVVFILLSYCGMVAIKTIFAAADYPWTKAIEFFFGADITGYKKQVARLVVITVSCTVAAIALRYQRLGQLSSIFSALGISLGLLCVARWIQQDYVSYADTQPLKTVTFSSQVAHMQGNPIKLSKPRRVVWVIFDEMDGKLTMEGMETKNNLTPRLKNFQWLRSKALEATNANSPARDTEASLPALLTGHPVYGHKKLGAAKLSLQMQDGTSFLFSESATVFEGLPGGPSTGSINGFYHPYCQILTSVRSCSSNYLAYAGNPSDALTYMFPKFLNATWNEHYRITDRILKALPSQLADRGQTLTFLHLNLPHLPSIYAQINLGMRKTGDAHEMYGQNLLATDYVLGQILDQLGNDDKHDTLLIVSTDHWWRLLSSKEARPIPYFIWHVGSSDPVTIAEKISTIHTARLIHVYLHGIVGFSHHELADWLRTQPILPTWMPKEEENDD